MECLALLVQLGDLERVPGIGLLFSFWIEISGESGYTTFSSDNLWLRDRGKKIVKEGDRGNLWEGEKEIFKDVTAPFFNDERH